GAHLRWLLAPERRLLIRPFWADIDRKAHKIRMLLDDLPQFPGLREFLCVLFQRDMNFRPAIRLGRWLDAELVAAVRNPHCGFSVEAITARNHAHLVRDHKHRIEPHAELYNHVAWVELSISDARQELACARLRDGSQILLHFLARHANA